MTLEKLYIKIKGNLFNYDSLENSSFFIKKIYSKNIDRNEFILTKRKEVWHTNNNSYTTYIKTYKNAENNIVKRVYLDEEYKIISIDTIKYYKQKEI